MRFSSIQFSSFRNIVDGEISTEAERIFLIGENGQGKTNILEAVYYLSYGVSFRGTPDSEAARMASSSFALTGDIQADLSENLPPERVSVRWEGGTKDIRRNDKKVRDRKELVQLAPSVVFCHEDFSFAAGDPERRRFFFDQAAGLVSPTYIDSLRDYRRVLKQRNAALKESRLDLLPLLDLQLVGKGLELMLERARVQAAFTGRFASRYEAVSSLGEEVRVEYRPSWPAGVDGAGAIAKLESRRQNELALGTTLSGPHRDRWTFVSRGRDFTATASTGQSRLISLTLRIVQAECYTDITGRLPVLLLDDVLLELDPPKRKRFLDLLPSSGQSFFTFLPGEPWRDYETGSSLAYEVTNGRCTN